MNFTRPQFPNLYMRVHFISLRLLLLLFLPFSLNAQEQEAVFVADQTFRLDGKTEYFYAFAQGDAVELTVSEFSGKSIRSVEFIQFPDYMIYRAYNLDTTLRQRIPIPKTGVYMLRIQEAGLGKKVCRFTIHRRAASAEMTRFVTQVPWDVYQIPEYQLMGRPVEVGKKMESLPLNGQVTVSASKMFTKKAVNAYQFTLPPYTTRWAYRVAVGQAAVEARRRDAEKLTLAMKSNAAKMLGLEPETALAAFALGLVVDVTVSTAGEDVEYAIVDWDNWTKFSKNEPYTSFIYQSGISVDAQRRFAPLSGTYYFALKSDNWVDDINVLIDIEAITETPVYQTEWYLMPVRP